jgi:hypothetical protein
MTIELTIKKTIAPAMICNAFVGAFEGGSNYWLHSAELKFADKKPDPELKLVWYGHDSLYEGDFTFEVGYDDPDEDEGEGNGKKLLSYPRDVTKGLELMAEKSPNHFADLLNENDDAITHDVLMQYIVLGDIVYG